MSPEPIHLRRAPVGVRVFGDDARTYRDQLQESAREEILEAGRREGREQALGAGLARLDAAVTALEQAKEELVSALAADAVQLAREIARSLVISEVQSGNHDLEPMVRETLRAADVGRGQCVVHLHPDDAESLRHATFRSGTTIEADLGVSRGNVHVSTPRGLLVRDLDCALASIAERILGDLR